jgi:hypothetical protein
VQALAQIKCVNTYLLVHYHHHIVSGLIIHQQITVTVSDNATCGVLDSAKEGIAVSIPLEIITQQLQRKETNQIYQDNEECHTT